MAEDTTEENLQFAQVLNRLDALMKRSHVPLPVDEPEADAASIPVLTEIYRGVELSPVAVAERQEAPLLMTEFVSAPQPEVEEEASQPESPAQSSRQQEIESVVAELMPRLREMMVRVVQEEFLNAQQNLSLRICQEAEQVLRLHLQQETKPK